MTPGVQSRDDTPSGGGHDRCDRHHSQTLDGILAVRLPRRIGIELLLSVTGEAEAGSAGEQPAEE
jgi:hypothetical protein